MSAARVFRIAMCFVLLGSGGVFGQQVGTNPDTARKLFRAMDGRWSCEGGFTRGGALAADLSFTLSPDGRAMWFEHLDRAPNVYWQRAIWGLESAGRIVSLGMAGSTKERSGNSSFFVAYAWSANSVTFVADTIKAPPFAPNRFTYSTTGENTLKMVWELARGGTWAVGDSLLCTRKR
jgi:hypothetical protein